MNIERLEKASRDLLAAMDDMHQRGETFTARVSICSSRLRGLLGAERKQQPKKAAEEFRAQKVHQKIGKRNAISVDGETR